MRERFCRVCRGWHNTDQPWPHNCIGHFGEVATRDAPYVISDTIEIQSMHDGQHYTSKSKLRSEYRAHGVEEMGNDRPSPPQAPKSDREGISNELRRVYAEYNA